MEKIRALRADEVECRVGQITSKGCSLLLYKDSRCDKRILDETFGIYGWRNSYQEIKKNLFCTVSIWDDSKQQWIDKQDCGTESNTEKEKGEASDAFKRACFNLGIGRELYTRIHIWLNVETVSDGNRYKLKNPYEKWHVLEMNVDEKTEKITFLQIADKNKKVVFEYDGTTKQEIYDDFINYPVCIVCNKEITDVKNKDGTITEAREFANIYGDKCPDCIKNQMKENKKTMERGK